MLITRRSLLTVASAISLAPAFAHAEPAWMGERAIGSPAAKVTVLEFFSLTCTHCAHFANTTFPKVKSDLIDTGKVRYVYRDFPLDQVALTAAMVARTLPAERYEPFVNALFANPTEEMWKIAALAGMSRATFDAAIANTELKDWILTQQQADQTKYKISATPSFAINGKTTSGAMSFEDFAKLVSEAT